MKTLSRFRWEKGWVTLSGEVDCAYHSHVATRTVLHMRGVTGVLMTRIGGDAAAQDIGKQISEALTSCRMREAKHIAIKVHEGNGNADR